MDDKEKVSRVCEDDDDDDPENRYIENNKLRRSSKLKIIDQQKHLHPSRSTMNTVVKF